MLWEVASERQSFRLEQKGIILHYLTLRDIIGHYQIIYDITQRYVMLRYWHLNTHKHGEGSEF